MGPPSEGRIVVGVDGSPNSVRALSWAAHQAELTGAKLAVITTWEWPMSYGTALPFPSDWDPSARRVEGTARSGRARAETASRCRDRLDRGRRAPSASAGGSFPGSAATRGREPRARRVRRHAPGIGKRTLRHQCSLPRPRSSSRRLSLKWKATGARPSPPHAAAGGRVASSPV